MDVHTVCGFVAQEVKGAFWPAQVYRVRHKEDPHPGHVRSTTLRGGQERTGRILEDTGGPLPVGCIRLFNELSTKATHTHKLATFGQ